MNDNLEQEARSILELLEGKRISKVFRPRVGEICIECSDGTRLFANTKDGSALDFSITGGAGE
ncbi:hypothetical protein [Marinomonas balearica]|uniref:hypothetical protein n=1 Tax=Marinomonas balearica TaxID=491947 RepID=UPI00105B4C17|nr:hypothetical protein [Marinomonas balearica]